MIKKVATLFLALMAGLLFISTSVTAMTAFDCGNLKGCERKYCDIENQLKIALEIGNNHKADGLRKSLKNAKKHCTDKGLKQDLVNEIEEVKKDIADYEADLKEAEEYGKTNKIHKYQEKINEKNSKIIRLEDELSNLE